MHCRRGSPPRLHCDYAVCYRQLPLLLLVVNLAGLGVGQKDDPHKTANTDEDDAIVLGHQREVKGLDKGPHAEANLKSERKGSREIVMEEGCNWVTPGRRTLYVGSALFLTSSTAWAKVLRSNRLMPMKKLTQAKGP